MWGKTCMCVCRLCPWAALHVGWVLKRSLNAAARFPPTLATQQGAQLALGATEDEPTSAAHSSLSCAAPRRP